MHLCSVGPSVHASVPAKKFRNFWRFERIGAKFSGPLNSSQVTFGRVNWTQGLWGSGPEPKKGVSAKTISSEDFGAGWSCCTFSELGQRGKKNVGSRILIFGTGPEKTGPEGGAGLGYPKFLNFDIFYQSNSPLKTSAGRCCFYSTFWSDKPWGPSSGRVKIKSQKRGIFYKRDPP